jgi:hypothetical protein
MRRTLWRIILATSFVLAFFGTAATVPSGACPSGLVVRLQENVTVAWRSTLPYALAPRHLIRVGALVGGRLANKKLQVSYTPPSGGAPIITEVESGSYLAPPFPGLYQVDATCSGANTATFRIEGTEYDPFSQMGKFGTGFLGARDRQNPAYPELWASGLGELQNLSVGSTRFTFHWDHMEPNRGEYPQAVWENYAAAIGELQAQGIEIIALLNGTPDWASQPDAPDCDKISDPRCQDIVRGTWLPDKQYLENYKAWVREITIRFGIRYFEYWNEPNGCGLARIPVKKDGKWEWPCSNKLDRQYNHFLGDYVEWLYATKQALEEASPGRTVLSVGGLDDTATTAFFTKNGGGVRGVYAWIQSMPDKEPDRYFDAVTLHPYPRVGDGDDYHRVINLEQLFEFQGMLASKGDGEKPLWITEYGWDLTKTDQSAQAQRLVRALNWLTAGSLDFVPLAVHHLLYDAFEDTPCNPQVLYGLIAFQSCNPLPRQSYYAFRSFTSDPGITFPSETFYPGTRPLATVRHILPLQNAVLYMHGTAANGSQVSNIIPLGNQRREGGWYLWDAEVPLHDTGTFSLDLIADPGFTLYARRSIKVARLIESITANGEYWNFDASADFAGWPDNGNPLTSVRRYARGPCADAGKEPCTFDTRTIVSVDGHLIESITAYGKYYNFDAFDNFAAWPDNGRLLTSVPRYAQGPCNEVGKNLCTFDTRIMVSIDGHLIESITAYGKYYNFDASDNFAPWPDNGSLLTSVPRYAQGPCADSGKEHCTFDTRTMVSVDEHLIESITAYGKYYNFDASDNFAPWPDNGSLLTSVPRYDQGPCDILQAGQCTLDSRTILLIDE